VARHAVVIALPSDESGPVGAQLDGAGYEAIKVSAPNQLKALLADRRDVSVAVLDGETDLDTSLEYYSLLHDAGRSIPALMVLSPRALDRLNPSASTSSIDDEYFTRPYSLESLRWRIEAMLIRAQTVDDGSGNAIIEPGPWDAGGWSGRAQVVVVFSPKGGVGKTSIAINLAETLQGRRGQKVLLIDADTVTGHVTTSLGLEQVRTVHDSWWDQAEGGPAESLPELATEHGSGMRVVALTTSPLPTEILEPRRIADEIAAARRYFDYIVVDVHPSYSAVNRAIFGQADRILVPVTPDVPALRAAVQLRDAARELGIADRLALVVNRANSGVSVADMERTVGMPALAQIRSAGLFFVRAANEGRTVVERFPKERVSDDFGALADSLADHPSSPARWADAVPAMPARGMFGRQQPARA
jgi:MinD-like ATPase involved in chromosome partitioning or flagellar assembly